MRIRTDRMYLQHILDAIGRIEQYVTGLNEEAFEREELIQDAVIRQLEVIGEAARHLSSEVRGSYPEIPWRDIVGMRNKLIHDYLGVDIGLVWVTVQEDLPMLREQVQRVLQDLGEHID